MSQIDLNTFNALKDAMGDDFIIELVESFFAEAPDLLAQMRNALTSQDVDVFRRAAHSLKSNAATFGATNLADLAKELEKMARENNLDVGDKMDAIEESYKQAETELKSLK